MSARLVVVLMLLLSAGAAVEATFAAEAGFSGRRADCTVCHAPATPAATGHLAGLPEQYEPGASYDVTFGVTGGPDALPDGPGGGFEIEVEAGTVAPTADMDGLIRTVGDTIATYTPEGTAMRDWTVSWTAPSLDEPPEPVTLWLAVMAANGNHLRQPGLDDDGENGDATDVLQATIPAEPAAVAAWEAKPLQAPTWSILEQRDGLLRIEGQHTDQWAERLGYRLDDGAWQNAETDETWRLAVPADASIEVRSEGHGRMSEAVGIIEAEQRSPSVGFVVGLAALAIVTMRRR